MNTLEELLIAILNLIMVLMVPVIVFFIIYAGFKYVTARGNVSTIGEATKALTYAIIGAVIILGAVAISQMIKSTVDQFKARPTASALIPHSPRNLVTPPVLQTSSDSSPRFG
jgi:TRAP-type C4-dicarboxylate transport system permease small subunit